MLTGVLSEGKSGALVLFYIFILLFFKESFFKICLRWLTQRNIVVIPKSTNPKRIADNIHVKIEFFLLV